MTRGVTTYTPTVLSHVTSSPPAHSVPETITPTDRARDSLVITLLHDDTYMIVRYACTPIATDTESEPLEDPIETEETQPLSPRAIHNYTPAFLDYTPDTPHSNDESEPIEASTTRTASPSDSPSPLSPDHPLTQTSPTLTPSRAFYYCSTTRIAMPSPASSLTLPIRKRYRGTNELILNTDTVGDDSKAKGIRSESEDATPSATIAVDEDDFIEVGQIDAQRAPLWQSRYEDQREIHALRMRHVTDQREMHGLRERVATLERRMKCFERGAKGHGSIFGVATGEVDTSN
nr:hypothetical protein [Tanacetum cinerariifolium]